MKLNHYLLLSIPVLAAGVLISIYPLESMESSTTATQKSTRNTSEISLQEQLAISKLNIFYKFYEKLTVFLIFNEITVDTNFKKNQMIDVIIQNKIILHYKFNPTVDIEENKKKLQDIFDVISEMKWLISLSIRMGLDTLPIGIENLTNLIELDLSQNNLKTIPNSIIDSLKSLNMLSLADNPIVEKSGNKLNFGIEEIIGNGYTENKLLFKRIDIQNFVNKINSVRYIWFYIRYFFSDITSTEKKLIVNDLEYTKIIKNMTINNQSTSVIYNDDAIDIKIGKKSIDSEGFTKQHPQLYKKGPSLFLPASTYEIPAHTLNEQKSFLKIDEDIPIGYHIYLPKGPVQAIYVKVYGGNSYYPISKDILGTHDDIYLLSHGIAIIELSLLDLYELKGSQMKMSKEIHQKLHLSIDYFYNVLEKNPELIGLDNKEEIQGKRIVLKGSSFGGRTAIKHAELYPETFDGYISHDGGLLSADSWYKLGSIRLYKGDREQMKISSEWLDPSPPKWIDKIKDPILLLQNYDDNNVGAQMTLYWYKEARKAKKEVQLLVTPRGNPISDSNIDVDINKGHFAPKDEIDFSKYMDTMRHFILYGPSKLETMSEWSAEKYDVYANAFLNEQYDTLPLKDKFISWAWRLYNAHPDEEYAKKVRANYPKEKDIPEKTKELMTRRAHKSWEMFENQEITNGTIYDALAYLEENKHLNFKRDIVTDDHIRNMFKYHLPLFIDYLREKGDEVPSAAVIKWVMSDQKSLQIYKELLTKKIDPLMENYLLRILFIANPSLLDEFRREKTEYVKYQAEKQEALKAFDAFVQKQTKELPKTAWKETIDQVRGQVQEQAGKENLREAMKKIREEQKMGKTQEAVEGQ